MLHAFELGASGYLVKNAWFQSYAQAVLQVVNGGAAITPRLARRLLVHLDHKRRQRQSRCVRRTPRRRYPHGSAKCYDL